MARNGMGGRFAESDEDEVERTGLGGRSRGGRAMKKAQRALVDALPAVATRMAQDAMTGSIPHTKLMLQLLGLEDGGLRPQKTAAREKTSSEIITEEWNREP